MKKKREKAKQPVTWMNKYRQKVLKWNEREQARKIVDREKEMENWFFMELGWNGMRESRRRNFKYFFLNAFVTNQKLTLWHYPPRHLRQNSLIVVILRKIIGSSLWNVNLSGNFFDRVKKMKITKFAV